MAGLISNPTAGIFDSAYTNAGVTGSFSGQAFNASFSATACFDGFCPGQAVPGAGPDYDVSDPLTMKLTGFQTVCASGFGCQGLADAYFSFVATQNAQYGASFAIDGYASPGLNLNFGGLLVNQNTSTSLSGNQTLAVPPVSIVGPVQMVEINDSFSLGTLNVSAGDRILARVSLIFPAMGPGESIILPDSLTLTLADTAVPEPATWGLMAAALAVLVIGRTRLS